MVAGLTGASRARAKQLVVSGAALVDGRKAAPSARLPEGSVVTIEVEDPASALAAADVPYSVARDDRAFVVIDKPAGVVVHPGAGHEADTLVNGLVGRYPELRDLGPEKNWGLVHRLDRDTSGLLLVAKDRETHTRLQSELRARRITRSYLALASGREFDNATGTIEAPIGRDPRRPTRMAVVHDGKQARTHYVRLAAWPGVTLLEVTLDTGRTHQIRVHFSAIHAPLVGDRTYGAAKEPGESLDRVWLHAGRLAFDHPDDGTPVDVGSRPPVELRSVLAALGEPVGGEIPHIARPEPDLS